MASFNASNPHQGGSPPPRCCSHDHPEEDLHAIFKSCRGAPITEASKRIFSVNFLGSDFPLADVRLLVESKDPQHLDLEFFFDGELDQLGKQPGDFSKAFTERISEQLKDERANDLRRILQHKDVEGLEEFKKQNLPDLEIFQIGTDAEAFRDAGCMLRFVAVRLRLNPAAATFIGSKCFPEYFGLDEEIDDRPMPPWLALVAVSAGVLLVAVVYAWGQIIRKALAQE